MDKTENKNNNEQKHKNENRKGGEQRIINDK